MNRDKICKVDDCGTAVYARDYCARHYEYNRKHGVPTPRPKPTCACGAKIFAKGLCQREYSLKRYHAFTADPTLSWPTPVRTYSQAHYRLKRLRGHARDLLCVECGGQARDWALRHDANAIADETTETRYRGSLFSPDLMKDYDPMCDDCHKAHDVKYGLRIQRRPWGRPRKEAA